jgi:hypothetical protein
METLAATEATFITAVPTMVFTGTGELISTGALRVPTGTLVIRSQDTPSTAIAIIPTTGASSQAASVATTET